MVIEILLIFSILLQLIAAIVAIGLTRKTKYNFSWMLFTIALTLMAFLRFAEYIQMIHLRDLKLPAELFVWMGIITSLCFAVGVLLVQKIFKYIALAENQRRLTEKRVLNTVLRTEEKERQRFSKDMHDGLGPLLSSAKMSLSALPDLPLERQKEVVNNARYVIDEAIRSLREIANNLSPHVLNNFGLARALSNFIGRLSDGGKISFHTNLSEKRFANDIEVILYRVLCELINNSMKHSGATEVVISLQHNKGNISIDYADNGCGFVPEEIGDRGMGFPNITSRISSLKGKVAIKSAPNEGMSAHINVPL